MWPFINSSQISSQVMTLPLKQAFNNNSSNNNNNNNQNFDLNLFAAAAALQQQQQQHQQQQQQQQDQQRKQTNNSFTSPFSVNSLLSPFASSQQSSQQLPQNNQFNKNISNIPQQQQQQLAAAVFTQHIAAAVANYRFHQQKFQQQQQQQIPINNEIPINLQPPNKKYKSENTYEPISYSISSPSSSSSTSSLLSSTASFNDYNNEINNNNLDMNNKIQSEQNEQQTNSNSTSLSSSMLNDSTNYDDQQQQQQQRQVDGNTPDNCKNSFVRRSSRKRNSFDLQNPCCPICGLSLRLNDLQAHIDLELEKLDKLKNSNSNSNNMHQNNNNNNDLPLNSNHLVNISNNLSNHRKRTSSGSERLLSSSSSLISTPLSSFHQNEANYKARYLNYLRIKENRQTRLKSKLRIRVKETENGTLICPICIEPLKGTKKDINSHLENCSASRLNSSTSSGGGGSEGEKEIDIESNGPTTSHSIHEVFEEYEWAGQKRIRTISLLKNPAQELGAVNVQNEEFDGELNVDSDDRVESYGKSQFNESDIIPMHNEDSSVNILRKAVIGNNGNNESESESMNSSESDKKKTNNSKCLICMDSYSNPLVSVNCWHVYCKQCWLHSLGAKKLCPQCNVITTAEDLRRIFL